MKQCKIIVFDGKIAAGKTTLIDKLEKVLSEKSFNVTVIDEPVKKWVECGILQRFGDDKKRWAYHFQTKAFIDRILLSSESYEANKDTTDFFLLERSPVSDMVFMKALYEAGDIDDLEWEHYNEWCNCWIKLMTFTPTHSIYLHVDSKTALQRILVDRKRPGELNTTVKYLDDLERVHDELLGDGVLRLPNGVTIPSLRVNSDENTLENVLNFIL